MFSRSIWLVKGSDDTKHEFSKIPGRKRIFIAIQIVNSFIVLAKIETIPTFSHGYSILGNVAGNPFQGDDHIRTEALSKYWPHQKGSPADPSNLQSIYVSQPRCLLDLLY